MRGCVCVCVLVGSCSNMVMTKMDTLLSFLLLLVSPNLFDLLN